MLTINRGCSYEIITRALALESQPYVGLLTPTDEDCEIRLDPDQLQAGIDANPDAIIVYNQQVDAIALIDSLRLPAAQIFIEIRQDTKGVLGLHALRKAEQEPETLELI